MKSSGKRWMSAAVAVSAASLILSGCGAAGGGGGKTADGVTTVKMVLWPGPEGDAMQKVVDAYNSGQGVKDKINVDMVLLSRTDTFSKEATMMASKSSEVDVYFTTSYILGQHVQALEPLDFVPKEQYFDISLDGLQYDGKQYAVPLDVGSHGLIYRTDLIDAMLADPDTYADVSEKVFGTRMSPKHPDDWNWDDFLAAGAYFTKRHNPEAPTTNGTVMQAKNLLFNVMLWNDALWSYGGSWTDEKGAPAIDGEAGENAVNLYRSAYEMGIAAPSSAQAEFPEAQAGMTSGSVAFIPQWTVGFSQLNDPATSPETAGKIALAPMPGESHRTHVHALAIGLNKHSAHKDAATTWMTYLTTPEAMKDYAKAGGLPSYPSVLEELKDTNPLFGFTLADLPEHGYTPPIEKGTYSTLVKLAQALSGAWVGEGSVDDALRDADKVIADTLTSGDK